MKCFWKLAGITEQKVLRVAVSHLFERFLAVEGAAAIPELPKWTRGAPAIVQASFLRQLLHEDIELKSAQQSDVSAAQPDLRRLSLLQLLAIRARNIDFATSSTSHSAHRSFLATVDTLLMERVAERALALEGGEAPRPEALRALGFELLLVVGAAQVLAAEPPCAGSDGEEDVSLPAWWAIRLDSEAWGGRRAALFSSRGAALTARLVADADGFGCVADGDLVAVTFDRGSGGTQCRDLRWEVVAFDPRHADVLAELSSDGHSHAADATAKQAAVKREVENALTKMSTTSTALSCGTLRFSEDGDDDNDDGGESQERTETTKSYLLTPPRGGVSRTVRGFESKMLPWQAQPRDGTPAPVWTKTGWRWQRSNSMEKQHEVMVSVMSIDSIAESTESVARTGSLWAGSVDYTKCRADSMPVEGLDSVPSWGEDDAEDYTDDPGAPAAAPPPHVAACDESVRGRGRVAQPWGEDELEKLEDAFSAWDRKREVHENQYCGMPCCAGTRSEGFSLLGSIFGCGLRA